MHSCRTKEIFITHINMNEDTKKRELIAEKARIKVEKAEYRKIMNESGGTSKEEVKGKEVPVKQVFVKAPHPSSSKGKRKERTTDTEMINGDDVGVGSRVKVKFKDGVWYKGSVSTLVKGRLVRLLKLGLVTMMVMRRKVIGRIRILMY